MSNHLAINPTLLDKPVLQPDVPSPAPPGEPVPPSSESHHQPTEPQRPIPPHDPGQPEPTIPKPVTVPPEPEHSPLR